MQIMMKLDSKSIAVFSCCSNWCKQIGRSVWKELFKRDFPIEVYNAVDTKMVMNFKSWLQAYKHYIGVSPNGVYVRPDFSHQRALILQLCKTGEGTFLSIFSNQIPINWAGISVEGIVNICGFWKYDYITHLVTFTSKFWQQNSSSAFGMTEKKPHSHIFYGYYRSPMLHLLSTVELRNAKINDLEYDLRKGKNRDIVKKITNGTIVWSTLLLKELSATTHLPIEWFLMASSDLENLSTS